MRLRVWLCEPNGDRVRELLAQQIEWTPSENGDPTLKVVVSRVVHGAMPEPRFVLRLETAHDGGVFAPAPRDDFFIVEQSGVDATDVSDTVTYTGTGYLAFLLRWSILSWSQTAKDGERIWTENGGPASAGSIMLGMVQEAKGRGEAAHLTADFTWNRDSDGIAWLPADKVKQGWRMLDPLLKHLDTMAQQGMCDWVAAGLNLRLYRPGSGADLSNVVVLGTPGMTRVPVRVDASEQFTHLTVVSDKLAQWVPIANTGADTRFGRLAAVQTQSGVEDVATATRNAQSLLETGRTAKLEESFEWTPTGDMVAPVRDFAIGDTVTVVRKGARVQRRVVAWTIRQDENGPATVMVVVGQRVLGAGVKAAARARAAVTGGFSTGTTIPAAGSVPLAPPAAPSGVRVDGNVGRFAPDGTARADVTIAWNPVATATDGTTVEVTGYELWARPVGGIAARVGASAEPSLLWGGFEPGVPVLVKVRAGSAGLWSAFSEELSVTPQTGGAPVGVPSAPILGTAGGAVFIRWDGLIGGQLPAAGVAGVYAQYRVGDGAWTRVGGPVAAAAGEVGQVREAVGTSVEVRLLPVDPLGRAGSPSSTATRVVSGVDIASLSPEFAAAVNGAIVASLDEYAVNTSTTVPPTSGWDPDTPDWEAGEYVWRRTRNTHVDGTISYSAPAVITGPDGQAGEDAVLLRISSSKGTAFKNSSISTVLTVTVFRGALQVVNLAGLWEAFGTGAYLEWSWRRLDDDVFGVISSADPRLSQGGFALTISPADVDEKTDFQCQLHT